MQLAITLLKIFIGKYIDTVSAECHECHECGHVTFPGTSYNVCNFKVEMSTFKQAIKLSFRRNKFGKRKVQNLQTRIYF